MVGMSRVQPHHIQQPIQQPPKDVGHLLPGWHGLIAGEGVKGEKLKHHGRLDVLCIIWVVPLPRMQSSPPGLLCF